MGAKSWMIIYSDGRPRDVLTTRPKLDEAATDALVNDLFGGTAGQLGPADLFSINFRSTHSRACGASAARARFAVSQLGRYRTLFF